MSEWTVDTLKELHDRELADQKRAVATALDALDRRLQVMNGFRDAMGDQAAAYITRSEVESELRLVSASVSEIDKRVTRAEGHGAGIGTAWAVVLAVLAGLGTLFGIYSVVIHR